MTSQDALFVVGTTTADQAAIVRALVDAGLEASPQADGGRLSVRSGPSALVLDVSATAPSSALPEAAGYVTVEAAMGRAEPLLDQPHERAQRTRLGFVVAGAVMALWEARLAVFVASPAAGGRVESAESFCRAVLAAPRDRPLVGPFVHYRASRDASEVRSEGAALLGLPEVATAATPRTKAGIELAERSLHALLLLWASPIEPLDNLDLPRRYDVTELPSGDRWLTDKTLASDGQTADADDAAHTKYQYFFRHYACAAFVGVVADVDAWLVGPPRFHVARVACRSGLVAYVTNGLGAKPQAGAPEEEDRSNIELCAMAPCEVPGLADIMARLGSIVHAPGPPRPPLRPWDRCAIACPPDVDIAGVVLRPLGAFEVEPKRRVNVWDALPITREELAGFRADPAAQGRWIDERFAREDYAALHERWQALAGTS